MNEMIEQFHFLRPWWWLALFPALVLCIGLWRARGNAEHWSRIVAARFLPYLLEGAAGRTRRWPLLGLMALWFATVFALAGPVWKKIPQPVQQNLSSVVICWDMSPSMLAEDIKPSRLARSRLKIIDFLKAHQDGQTGLIAYSAEAYVVTPLTDDHKTIVNLLPALSPTTLPSTGSNPEMAFEEAEKLLKEAGATTGHIVFVTDGISPDAFDYLEAQAQDSLYKMTIWAVGTEEGAPIPLPNGGFARDRTGDMVVARMNENEMADFAGRAEAYYVPMSSGDEDLSVLMQLLNDQSLHTEQISRVFNQWYEHGYYLTLLLLPFLAGLFRRGWIFSLVLCLPLGLHTTPSHALSWQDLWLTPDQQAQQRMEDGDAATAADLFTKPERRGAAHYKSQNYEAAAQEFANADAGYAAYNRGTALTQAGQYEEAIEAFNRALEQNPQHESARHNREIAQKLAELEQQQQQQQQQQQSQDGERSQEGQQSQNQDEGQSGGAGQDQTEQAQQSGRNPDGEGESNPRDGDPLAGEKSEQAQQSDGARDSQGNPFSEAADEQEAKGSAGEPGEPDPDSPGQDGVAGVAHSQENTEEQQMLEQMLRKIPDDPSGLLRNKFKYQYLQRKQSLQYESPVSGNQAENRW